MFKRILTSSLLLAFTLALRPLMHQVPSPPFVAAVMAATGGRGVDKIVDSTGASILDRSFATNRLAYVCVGPIDLSPYAGQVIRLGFLVRTPNEPGAPGPNAGLFLNDVTVRGETMVGGPLRIRFAAGTDSSINHGGWARDRVLRVWDRTRGRYQEKEVHAEVDVDGPVRELRHPLLHITFRSWDTYLRKIDRYTAWGAEDLRKRGRRATVADLVFRPIARF